MQTEKQTNKQTNKQPTKSQVCTLDTKHVDITRRRRRRRRLTRDEKGGGEKQISGGMLITTGCGERTTPGSDGNHNIRWTQETNILLRGIIAHRTKYCWCKQGNI